MYLSIDPGLIETGIWCWVDGVPEIRFQLRPGKRGGTNDLDRLVELAYLIARSLDEIYMRFGQRVTEATIEDNGVKAPYAKMAGLMKMNRASGAIAGALAIRGVTVKWVETGRECKAYGELFAKRLVPEEQRGPHTDDAVFIGVLAGYSKVFDPRGAERRYGKS
jgi:hypothetical protein